MKDKCILIDCVSNDYIYFENIDKASQISTHKGNISIDDINNYPAGSVIHTHKGHPYRLTDVDLHDYIMFGLKRETQIVYPKDSFFISGYLGLKNGDKVFECGLGSGAMAMVMANSVAPDGKIFSYEKRERFIELAKDNLKFDNLINFVEFSNKDLEVDEIGEGDFDAAFVDSKEPWNILRKVSDSLKAGKKMCILVPTFNQVIEVLKELKRIHHFDIAVKEIFIRDFKTLPDRVRPEDRMVAHTGFIIFSRKGV